MAAENKTALFRELLSDARDFYLPTEVRELEDNPSPLCFLREHVMTNVPLVIRGGVKHWPAVEKWSDEYLCETLGDKTVTVSMTPNGYADAPVGEKFVLPHEEQMKMSDFLKMLNNHNSKDVVYIQKQNSSFTDEFHQLVPDAASEISWTSEAFGSTPDAINFWMGGNRSITSTHKDPYENLYCVVRGSKTFTLYPPLTLPFMPYQMFSLAKYVRRCEGVYDIVDEKTVDESRDDNDIDEVVERVKHEGKVHKDETVENNEQKNDPGNDIKTGEEPLKSSACSIPKVPWIACNPLKYDARYQTFFDNSRPLVVTLQAGDVLYLPSLWFHHVQQTNSTIAVNFWYDMNYDAKYVYFKFLEKLSQPRLSSLVS
ncbi:bifunctional peptidase and (3S)-lysyl hydroxylase Jmjd7-like [Clytia hemisphaerica]|uniref:JmjC domain-containing protein n=1 Tax=Clytia hemisphaerica TaxID=252671 RepID=A0A7M5UPP9_9CNID|eukprot:TCONS_00022310-protein